ncbi:ABC transporter permease [Naasia sp.]|uniref:ABC transporter permease n=1 Tax=Naasia sp. TaxID=2546198 RepID=UPI00260E4983|nr:ABC transporter permease [Naasia sp.]
MLPTGGARRITLHAIVHHRRAFLGAILTAIVLLIGVVGAFWTPYDPMTFNAGPAFSPPDLAHPIGTDVYGRDILSRVMAGAQVSLLVSAGAVGGSLVAGTIIGLLAGYLGGFVDVLLTRVVDIMLAIPGLVLALGIVTLLSPSALSVTVALIAVYTWQFARIVRSSVVAVRHRPYVEAAKGLGSSGVSIVFRDIFPSVLPVLIVQVATAFAWGILDEASIGFLGLGVQPPSPSWGSLLIEGRQYLYDAPWLPIGAGAVVVIAVLGVNLLGDGLRDIVDPRSGGTRS